MIQKSCGAAFKWASIAWLLTLALVIAAAAQDNRPGSSSDYSRRLRATIEHELTGNNVALSDQEKRTLESALIKGGNMMAADEGKHLNEALRNARDLATEIAHQGSEGPDRVAKALRKRCPIYPFCGWSEK